MAKPSLRVIWLIQGFQHIAMTGLQGHVPEIHLIVPDEGSQDVSYQWVLGGEDVITSCLSASSTSRACPVRARPINRWVASYY